MNTSRRRSHRSRVLIQSCVVLLALTVSYAPQSVFTPRAEAFSFETNPVVIVGEIAALLSKAWDSTIKPGLDAAAWTLAKKAVQSLTKSTVNWINDGFDGSPAYVTDLSGTLLQVSDALAGKFVSDIANSDFICAPFRLELADMLNLRYLKKTDEDAFLLENTCTLTGIIKNVEGFVNNRDFTEGGWRGWLALTTEPGGNIYGGYFSADRSLGARLENAQGEQLEILNWNKGFFSWCGKTDSRGSSSVSSNTQICRDKDGKPGTIQTPGSVIESQLTQQLGSSVRQLELADSFNEVIFAAATALIEDTIGPKASGLLGTSRPPAYIRPSSLLAEEDRPLRSSTQKATETSTETAPVALRSVLGLVQAVTDQIDTLEDFRANWRIIQSNAATTKGKLNARLVNSRGKEESASCPIVTQVINQRDLEPIIASANAAIDKSDRMVIALIALRGRANQQLAILKPLLEKKAAAEAKAATGATLTEAESISEAEEASLTGAFGEVEKITREFDLMTHDETRMPSTGEISFASRQSVDGGETPPYTLVSKSKLYLAKSDDNHRCGNVYNILALTLDDLVLAAKFNEEAAQATGNDAEAALFAQEVQAIVADAQRVSVELRTSVRNAKPLGDGIQRILNWPESEDPVNLPAPETPAVEETDTPDS